MKIDSAVIKELGKDGQWHDVKKVKAQLIDRDKIIQLKDSKEIFYIIGDFMTTKNEQWYTIDRDKTDRCLVVKFKND